EPKDLEHRELDGVVLVAEDLLRSNRPDATRHRREREHELVAGETGLDTADVERRAAGAARSIEACDLAGIERGGIKESRDGCGDDVRAVGEHATEIVDR